MRRLCAESEYPEPLLAVAGFELSTHEFPTEPLAPQAWNRFLTDARKHRLLGHAQAAVQAGALPVSSEQMPQLRTMHRAIVLRMLMLEQTLVSVVKRGLDVRVLKGSAYAHLDYPNPSLRSFADLDLLVRATDFSTTVQELADAGFTRILPEPRPGFDARFDKGTTMRRDGVELDLHRTFVLGPWGRQVDTEALWSASETFELAGAKVQALTARHRFLHACYHASLGDWPLRLGSLRDVAQLLPHASVTQATSWGVQAVVAAAVSDATRLLALEPTTPIQTWATNYTPTPREEQWLALHTHEGKTFAAQALATLPTIPGIREKAAYLRALLFPDQPYTAGRHKSPLARLRFGLKEAIKGSRPH